MRQTANNRGRSALGHHEWVVIRSTHTHGHEGRIIAEVSIMGERCLGYTPLAAAQTHRALARALEQAGMVRCS